MVGVIVVDDLVHIFSHNDLMIYFFHDWFLV